MFNSFLTAQTALYREHFTMVPNPCLRTRQDPAWDMWKELGHDVESEELPGFVLLEGRHRCEYLLKKLEDDPKRKESPWKFWVRAMKAGEPITPEEVPSKLYVLDCV